MGFQLCLIDQESMADRRTVGDMLADTLITAMKEKEEQLDKEIEKYLRFTRA